MRSANLAGKKGLVVGIANAQSIAWGAARAMRAAGAELAVTWYSDKSLPYVTPLFDEIGATLRLPLDVSDTAQQQALFDTLRERWGRLDFLVHSVAFAPRDDLHGRVLDSSAAGFAQAMDLSCHSFIRLARDAEPLMAQGGSMMTISYLGAQAVMPGYGIMGPVKAALEASVRYLASELGPRGIRVNAVSPGPLETRAASGIAGFDSLIKDSMERAPLRHTLDIEDAGALCAFLASDAARAISGSTLFVDNAFHILN